MEGASKHTSELDLELGGVFEEKSELVVDLKTGVHERIKKFFPES